jgi:D-hexose-6-phosphate mutarotase
MTDTIDQLNRRFAIDGIARFDCGEGGLTRLSIASEEADAALYLHGGHVTHFQPRGAEPVLWMSAASRFATGQAIRGGVPIVFPWFGANQADPSAPAHGLVRTAQWSVHAIDHLLDFRVRATLAISVDAFDVVYRVTVGRPLELEMIVTNTSGEAVAFEQALHTYLAVGDVRRIGVHGLEGATYVDKVDGFTRKTQPGSPIRFSGETDSVYLDTVATVRVEDPVLGRTIVVSKTGSRSTVVWNPWIGKSKKMSDFGDDEWPGMVCVETANVADNAVRLVPGESAEMLATLAVE